MRNIKQMKHALKSWLNDMEFRRIEPMLNIILRDRAIRRDFAILRKKMGSYQAINILAERYFLSVDHIKFIVYNKNVNRTP
ncbi:MAG TPA: hypothetical protein ENK06_10600 [Gammaproteobacteria bacterium]|nr:hypothetical protein [Gammaproteobacteria bacterium]